MRHSEEVCNRIRTDYPDGDVPALAAELGLSENRLRTLAVTLGVRRSEEAKKRCKEAAKEKISEACRAHHQVKKARVVARSGLYEVFAQWGRA